MKKLFVSILVLLGFITSRAQTASLDPSFGNAGIVTHPGSDGQTSTLQPDGKILIADNNGDDIRVLRFLSNGSIDSSFGVNGSRIFLNPGTTESPLDIGVQPDGKVLVVGEISQGYYKIFAFRLNTDGAIDSSFAANGKFIHSFQGVDHFSKVLNFTNDNKILISGHFGTPRVPFHLKLNLNGSIDISYGLNGAVFVTDLGFSSTLIDSKILNTGEIFFLSYKVVNNIYSSAIVKLASNGSIDSSFGVNGIALRAFPKTIVPHTILSMTDGKLLIGGAMTYGNNAPPQEKCFILRYQSNGTLDNSFGVNGVVEYNNTYSTSCFEIALQPSDNKIVAIGKKQSSASDKNRLFITRFHANGAQDTEFGTPSTVVDILKIEKYNQVHITPEGGIVAIGASYPGNMLLVKYISCSNNITSQPQSVSSAAGTTATFTAISSSSAAIYQWQVMDAGNWENISNGGQYSGAQSASLSINNLTAANDGQQYRTISSSGVCVDTSSAAVLTVTSSSSINELNTTQAFSIYPNPVADVITIEGKIKVNSVQITDLLGRSIAVFEGNSRTKLQINLPPMSAGIYGLRIATQDGISNYKIIKK